MALPASPFRRRLRTQSGKHAAHKHYEGGHDDHADLPLERDDDRLPGSSRRRASAGSRIIRYVSAATRLRLGWIFLWAFLDELFGLGHETKSAQAWIHCGSPTLGFLTFGAKGPFADFYHSIAGAAWADWLFMIGLTGIGVALITGIAMRIAATSGALMLVLMWTVVLPPANNPFMDDHLVYALVLVLLALLGAGRFVGFGGAWQRLAVVQRYPFLK